MVVNLEDYLASELPIVSEYDDKYDKESIENVLKFCEEDDPVALFELGSRYRVGEGVEINLDKTLELYERVIKQQKHLAALYWLGRINSESDDEQKKKIGRGYLEIGSALGDGDCTEWLADLYRYGDEVDRDDSRAIDLYTKAIEQGNKNAYVRRGEMYINDDEMAEQGMKDFLSAYSESASDYTHACAAYRIGEAYHEGHGVEKDNNKAVEYLKEAADYGIVDACGMLGFIIGNGLGVEKDVEKAFEYFEMMGEDEEAQIHNLKGRILYADGREEEAVDELQKAVDLGNEAAENMLKAIRQQKERIDYRTASIETLIEAYNKGNQKITYILALTYRRGERGVKKDPNKSLKYYMEVVSYDNSELGTGHAYSDLAVIYLDGVFGQKDYAKALDYAQKSLNYTKLGSSYVTLSRIYDEGLGVNVDYEKAKEIAREGIKETDDGNMYAWYLHLLCRGSIEGERAREVEECMEKCLERTPQNAFVNHMAGQFYLIGAGEKFKKNVTKAIECFEISGESGNANDFCKIGDIYSKEEYGITDFRKAIEYYKKAWDLGDLFGAAGIAGLELADDFANEPWVDGRLGVSAGKEYLFHGEDNNLRIMCFLFVVQYLKRTYKSDKSYSIQQCRLICDDMKHLDLRTESDKQAGMLEFCMSGIIDGAILGADSFGEIQKILEKIEAIMERNQVMDHACYKAVGEHYYELGKTFIDNNMDLAIAKQFLEKSAYYGCEEGQILSNRIKKNLFGKLVFK